MIKIKLFQSEDRIALEQLINTWLKNEKHIKIKDIKYNANEIIFRKPNCLITTREYIFNAMIIYAIKNKEERNKKHD